MPQVVITLTPQQYRALRRRQWRNRLLALLGLALVLFVASLG